MATIPATQSVWRRELRPLAWMLAAFVGFLTLPVGVPRFDSAVLESLHLARDYAQHHVLTCLVPAFFIAGAISAFVSQGSVMRYLGPRAPRATAYGVASVSGTVLAVCSCTVLPLFAGIYRMGAGLGPASAFLYAGPAINVLALILTARVLGFELGVARAVGAIGFSIVIGLLMHVIFRREERAKAAAMAELPESEGRPLYQSAVFFALMIGVLVFANWGSPDATTGFWATLYAWKWTLTALCGGLLGAVLITWYGLEAWKAAVVAAPAAVLALLFPGLPQLSFAAALVGLALVLAPRSDELGEWFAATWGFAKLIVPLLFVGVLAAGLLLGRPGHEGLIPSAWIAGLVGGNGLGANLFAAVIGAFMYFATLTEVPILQGLLGSGMGKGPALALLLAGPALSLPSMLVIRGILGTKKTLVYIALVVVLSTASGIIYGTLA